MVSLNLSHGDHLLAFFSHQLTPLLLMNYSCLMTGLFDLSRCPLRFYRPTSVDYVLKKIPAQRPTKQQLTSQLKTLPSKRNTTCDSLLEKQGPTNQ